MKQSEIIRAYRTIDAVYNKKMPMNLSHALFLVKKSLQPHWDFQAEKEREAMMKYSPSIGDGGRLTFASEEQEKECMAEFAKTCAELAELDVNLDGFTKPRVAISMDVDIMSPADMEALDGFIDFVGA